MAEVDIRGVSKSYAGKTVLHPLDLTIADGEFCSLLGSSGSGKSTLLRIVAGLTTSDSGHVMLNGRDVTSVEASRRKVGFVFQSYALFPHMSVGANIAFGLKGEGLSRAEAGRAVGEMLELVGLSGYAPRRPSELSGGQQQRVALARALVTKPEVLLLDEPLSALDRKIRGDLQQQLKRLHEETQLTTIMVTHDQDEAMGLSSNIVMLDDGAVQQIGSPREFVHSPANRFVADFLGAEFVGRGVAGVGTVEIQGAVLPSPEHGLAPGEPVDVLITSDAVSLKADVSSGEGSLVGQLVRLDNSGRLARCLVRVGGVDVPVTIPSRSVWDVVEGASVTVSFGPQAVHLFAAGETR